MVAVVVVVVVAVKVAAVLVIEFVEASLLLLQLVVSEVNLRLPTPCGAGGSSAVASAWDAGPLVFFFRGSRCEWLIYRVQTDLSLILAFSAGIFGSSLLR